jgi:hypothetical protein
VVGFDVPPLLRFLATRTACPYWQRLIQGAIFSERLLCQFACPLLIAQHLDLAPLWNDGEINTLPAHIRHPRRAKLFIPNGQVLEVGCRAEKRFLQVGTLKRFLQVGTFQIGMPEVGILQVGQVEVGTVQVGIAEFRPFQMGAPEIDAL